ncbi:MAG TPA: DUF4105 domain-containing protein [Longimicrobiales bacterium]|nr:DUF4105 domain-containing protein [Longimicrobiales bacterium]
MRYWLRLLSVLSLVPLLAQPAQAQVAAVPGSDLTVYLATFGPGDAVWEKFGHNAIWIRDATTRTSTSYNYGMFHFDQPGFVPRLMKGRMLYSMGVYDAEAELAAYMDRNRSVWVQQLNLTADQKHRLREYLEQNYARDGGSYLYDYFRDNCSTRIRDALDHVLGGSIRRALVGTSTGTTFRSHSLRLTAASIPTYTGLMLGLGRPTDRAIDAWEESFIPMELMSHLRNVMVSDADGNPRPLVAEERIAFDAVRQPPPDQAPSRVLGYLIVGIGLAAGLTTLARRGPDSRRAQVALAILVSLWGVLTGFFGSLLALLLLTDHSAAHSNLNLLQVNPLGFLLAVAGPLAIVAAQRFPRMARLAWPAALALAGLSATGLMLHLVPSLAQDNGPIIALALPVHLALVLCLYHMVAPEMSPIEDKSLQLRLNDAA